jgi:aerobic carbon-monoxide dehydrogenase medium subunit
MIPPSFDYTKPSNVDDAVAALHQHGEDARVLAGGQSLLVLLKARSITPKILVDIGGLADLRGIARENGTLVLGALATLAEITQSEEVRRSFPLFGDAAAASADPMVRNRATFAGSLVSADPAADWPAIALALDACVEARCTGGSRTIPVDDFFRDAFTTALQPDELVTRITFPVRHGRPAMVYRKLRHPASGFAMVGVAAVAERGSDETCIDCRVAITGAGRRPVRAKAVEGALHGQKLTSEAITQAAERACEGLDLTGDLFGSAEYRGLLARTYVKRALQDLLAVLDSQSEPTARG